jgi:hypothetical protein
VHVALLLSERDVASLDGRVGEAPAIKNKGNTMKRWNRMIIKFLKLLVEDEFWCW